MAGPDLARTSRTLSATAAACAALVFVVVAASAWLRLAAEPCPPAGCAGLTLADAVRLAHRVAAMGVSVLALLVVALAWKGPPRPGRRAAAVAIAVLVAALAIVGRSSAGSPPPAVVLANLVGGLALLATAAGLSVAVRNPGSGPSAGVGVAAALYAVATLTGAVLAAAPPAEPSALALAHRALSWASLAAWCFVAASAPPGGARLAARAAAALLVLQVVLALALPAGPAARWLHNLLASGALCAVVAAALAAGPARRRNTVPDEGLSVRP